MEAVVLVTQNTYFIWQTVLAVVLLIGAGASAIGWLNKRLPKRGDIDALSKELAAVKSNNSDENNRIISAVREVKTDVKQLTYRLDHHIDKISAQKGTGDE